MEVPPLSEPRWRDLVTGQLKVNLDFLATKIVLSRVAALASNEQMTISNATRELHHVFSSNSESPKIQSDLRRIFGRRFSLEPAVYEVKDVAKRLKEGHSFLLAGSDTALSQVPLGKWIAGTSPHVRSHEDAWRINGHIYATELPPSVMNVSIETLKRPENLQDIYHRIPANGFSILIIPYGGSMHRTFAMEAPSYAGFASRPLAGWIAGSPLDLIESVPAKVFDGHTGRAYQDAAVVMHIQLKPNVVAEIGVLNVFEQGFGDCLIFEEDGFNQKMVTINGTRCLFAEYIRKNWPSQSLPLVADYNGLMINSSFQGIDEKTDMAKFFAPLFKGVQYRLARPIKDFEKEFLRRLPHLRDDQFVFSFNCMLNLQMLSVYETLIPRALLGPTTFGEIAYQLLNQTTVYIAIDEPHYH